MQYEFVFCVGQSYDGAAAMASERSGVTSIVHNESPLADYFHCAMHCLNLSASAAVKVSAIQNAENVARKVVNIFKAGVWGAECKAVKMRVFTCQIAYLTKYAKRHMTNCIFI